MHSARTLSLTHSRSRAEELSSRSVPDAWSTFGFYAASITFCFVFNFQSSSNLTLCELWGVFKVDSSRLLDISFGLTVGYSATHRYSKVWGEVRACWCHSVGSSLQSVSGWWLNNMSWCPPLFSSFRSPLRFDPDRFFPTQERAGAARSSPGETLYPCASAWAVTFSPSRPRYGGAPTPTSDGW